MKFSLDWLKRYMDTGASAAEASVSRNTLSQSSENFMPVLPRRR